MPGCSDFANWAIAVGLGRRHTKPLTDRVCSVSEEIPRRHIGTNVWKLQKVKLYQTLNRKREIDRERKSSWWSQCSFLTVKKHWWRSPPGDWQLILTAAQQDGVSYCTRQTAVKHVQLCVCVCLCLLPSLSPVKKIKILHPVKLIEWSYSQSSLRVCAPTLNLHKSVSSFIKKKCGCLCMFFLYPRTFKCFN